MKKENQGHHSRITKEFTRQSKTMTQSSAFTDEQVLERIIRAASPSKENWVLDIGSGPGIVATALAEYSKSVTAFDITPSMIEAAKKRSSELGIENIEFKVGRAENLPFEEDSFDIVVTRLTTHHFPEPELVLKEIRRVVKPGGRVVFADITSSENPEESELHNALEILRDPSHVRMLPLSELRQAILSSGLRIIEEDVWVMEREFGEWIRITNAPEREKPLFVIMAGLAKAGVKTGVDLSFTDGEVRFNHTWSLILAEKPA